MAVSEPAKCKCSTEGRNLVICIDGTSNQFGDKNTNVVELYSKIEKTKDSNQLTYYNSGIGTYAKPSWKSVKYLLQVVDNSVDLAIAWNFEKIIIGAYRWLSDNYEENDRIFLFGFSRGAYQVRALAGMIARVGLIYKGNEEQIPFAYEVYATHTENLATNLATNFKSTFSRANVQVHFVGVWDTVSSVGVIRGKSLPLTDSAEHICFFRHALALDERRVKFLPEYVHGGVCQKSPASEQPTQIQEVGLNTSTHIKEVWFPGTHSDIGGGTRLNPNLDLGRTPLLWMSFEAVSCGLKLRNTQVEWRWDHLYDMKESLTGVWRAFEWLPFKRLSYKDESSTVYRFHKGRGRKIKSGQKVHSSIAFCDDSYHPKAILAQQSCLCELVGKGSLSNREWVKGWEDLIEMDIFDILLLPNVIEKLKSGTGSDSSMWIYRLTAITSTDEGRTALRKRPNISDDLVQIFAHLNQPDVQECVIAILEKTSEGHASILLNSEHRIWLLRVARERSELEHSRRSFAVKLLTYSLSNGQSYEDMFDENALGTLDEMARDEQRPWMTNGAFAMFTTILSQNTLSQKLFSANTIGTVRKRFTAENSVSRDVAKRLFGAVLLGVENRQHLFDNDVLHSFLRKIDNLDARERLFFKSFLVNHYEYLPHQFFMLLTSKLCDNINGRNGDNSLLFLRDTIDCDGLRMRIWTSKIVEALQEVIGQVGSPGRLLGLELYRTLIIYDSLRDEVFDTNTVRNLGRALYDSNGEIRTSTVEFFTSTIAEGGFRDRFFSSEIVTELGRAVVDKDDNVRSGVVKIFTAALADDSLWNNIFDTETIITLRRALSDENDGVRSSAVNLLTAALAHGRVWDKIFDAETISALRYAIGNSHFNIRSSAIKIFTATIAHDGLRDKIFDTETISVLKRALSEQYSSIRPSMVKFFTAALAHDRLWDKIFDTEAITSLGSPLSNESIIFFTDAQEHDGLWERMFNTETISALSGALKSADFDIRSSTVKFLTAAVAHDGLWDKIFNIETILALRRVMGDLEHISNIPWIGSFESYQKTRDEKDNLISSVVSLFTAAVVEDGLRDKILDTETISVLGRALSNGTNDIRSSTVDFFTAAMTHEGVQGKIFNTEIVPVLGRALRDESDSSKLYGRVSAVKLFTVAMVQHGLRDQIFDTETISTLGRGLSDKSLSVRSGTVKFFTAALANEGVRDKIFNTEIVSLLVHALSDKNDDVGSSVVNFFTAAMVQDGLRDKIFDTETISALGSVLSHELYSVRSRTVKIFTAAMAHEGIRDKIFNAKIVFVLGRAIDDGNYQSRASAFDIFTAAIAHQGFRDKIFSDEIIAILKRALEHKFSLVGSDILQIFTAAIAQESFREKLFETKTITTFVKALGDSDSDVRRSAVKFFTAAIAQENFRDEIFNTSIITSIITALVDALHNWQENVRESAVNFFTTAIAQEKFRDEIFNNNVITTLVGAIDDRYSQVRCSAVKFFSIAANQEGFRDKIYNGETVPVLLKRILEVEFWSHDYLLTRAYNHFITSALCEQLTSTDSSLRAQTYYFISKAIEYDDVRARIYTAELRGKIEKHEKDMQVLPDVMEVKHAA